MKLQNGLLKIKVKSNFSFQPHSNLLRLFMKRGGKESEVGGIFQYRENVFTELVIQ